MFANDEKQFSIQIYFFRVNSFFIYNFALYVEYIKNQFIMKSHKKIFLSIMIIFCLSYTMVSAEKFRNISLNKTIDEPGPLKGIVLWTDNGKMNSYKNSIALEFAYCLPCQVVTGKSGEEIQYDWSSFETLLNGIAGRGHQAIIRFRYEYPGLKIARNTSGCTCDITGATAVPAYIKELSGYSETYSSNPGGDGNTYYADWSNSELQWFTKQFYIDFATKYDNDLRIAFIQVGFGHWSEYHIYGTTLNLGKNFPSKNYQAEFLQLMNDTFKKTPWNISIDAADSDYTPIVGNSTLMALNFGLFDDSFMHKNHNDYNEYCWNQIGTNRWKTASGGGEISYYTSSDQKNALNPEGMYGRIWEQEAEKFHITYMIANDAVDGTYATVERVKEASINSGYKFQITKYQVSDTQAKITVKNIGVAPIYHDAYVTVKTKRSDISLKGLLPTEEQEYIVEMAINADENPEPTITSDKILAGKTIPYQANLNSETKINNVSEFSKIKQTEKHLFFSGNNYTVNIYNLQGIKIAFTQEESFDFSNYPSGCYIVQYIGDNGEKEILKVYNSGSK